jgi:ribosomal protein L11 methyltransferase
VHIKLCFSIKDNELRELLIASLSEIDVDGFEETNDMLIAYIAEEAYNRVEVKAIAESHSLDFTEERIAQQNWNAEWEANFEPVIIEEFCTVRAAFHQVSVTTPYDIIITPKMSFGTGHHATTQLMIQQMHDLDFKGKSVLDFGTGTGILAILAEKLGASAVLAIDNDEWACENTRENIVMNACHNITVEQGSLEIIGQLPFDIIIANINRNILLQYMKPMKSLLKNDGKILLSGLLKEDNIMITDSIKQAGLKPLQTTELNNWISILIGDNNL